jgi:hypothetical protein
VRWEKVEEFSAYGIALVPIILGMVELLKRVGIPKKLSPLVAVILGILAGFYYLAPGDPKKAILFGVVSGLSAIGLWSGTKNTLEEFSSKTNDKIHKLTAVRGRNNRKHKAPSKSVSWPREGKRIAKK